MKGVLTVESTVATAMETITTAISNVFSVVTSCADQVMSHEYTAMFFVAGLIGIGCGVLGRLKRI